MREALSLCATGLAISRAVHAAISSRTTRLSQLDGALDLDNLGLASGLLEVAGGKTGVLGGDAHHPQPAQCLERGVRPGLAGEHHHAAPVAQVEQLIHVATGLSGVLRGLLEQHVLAGDAQVGGPCLDVRRYVRRAHRDHADVLEQEPAVVRAQLPDVETELREQLGGVVEQGSPGHRDRELADRVHRATPSVAGEGRSSMAPVPRSSPASAMCRRSTPSAKPTAGSARPKRPRRSS